MKLVRSFTRSREQLENVEITNHKTQLPLLFDSRLIHCVRDNLRLAYFFSAAIDFFVVVFSQARNSNCETVNEMERKHTGKTNRDASTQSALADLLQIRLFDAFFRTFCLFGDACKTETMAVFKSRARAHTSTSFEQLCATEGTNKNEKMSKQQT